MLCVVCAYLKAVALGGDGVRREGGMFHLCSNVTQLELLPPSPNSVYRGLRPCPVVTAGTADATMETSERERGKKKKKKKHHEKR